MALINCPECNKEISDKVKACPNCGYPFTEEPQIPEKIVQTRTKKNLFNKKIITVTAIVGLIILTIGSITYFTVVAPKKTYTQAIMMLENGKYDEATVLLKKIPRYEGVSILEEQMKYESKVFECITNLKKHLKNPDSLQVYDVVFYIMKDDEKGDSTESSKEPEQKNPVCIMNYGAQNGFGGNTTGYAIFSVEDYSLIGTCKTLDEDELDIIDDLADLIVCKVINMHKEESTVVGEVDLARIKTLLKNDSYSTIKIIQ